MIELKHVLVDFGVFSPSSCHVFKDGTKERDKRRKRTSETKDNVGTRLGRDDEGRHQRTRTHHATLWWQRY